MQVGDRPLRDLLVQLALSVVSLGFTLAQAAPARACSVIQCSYGYATPVRNGVPANAPALAYRPPTATPSLGLYRDGETDPLPYDEADDPVAPHHLLLRPRQPLRPGRYRFVDFSDCGFLLPPGAKYIFDYPFQVTEAAPLPTTIGTVVVRAPAIAAVGNACTGPQTGVVVVIEVRPSAEARAFLEVARFTLSIDGKPWHASDYGAYSDEPGFGASIDTAAYRLRVTAPFVVCGPNTAGLGFTPGRHRAELSMHIAGAETDPPPIAFELDLPECPPDPSRSAPSVPVPAAAGDASASSDATPATGTAGTAPPLPTSAPGRTAAGCSVATATPGWMPLALAAGTLVACVRRRRPRAK